MKKILVTASLLAFIFLQEIQAQRKLDFVPARHGFHFTNSFTSHSGVIHTSGLCGGMALAAFNFFRYNMPIPQRTNSQVNFNVNFDWALRTSGADPLIDYIFQSQVATFVNPTVVLFISPDDPDYNIEFNKVRARIDRGEYLILGLKDRNGGLGHQVLCYGYDPNGSKIFIYDPNTPGVETVITPVVSPGSNAIVLTAMVGKTEQTDNRFDAIFEEQVLYRNQISNLTNYNQLVNILLNNNFSVRPPLILAGNEIAGFSADGFYKIMNLNSGKAMEVKGYSRDNGAEICQWDFHGGDNQLWQIADAGNGFYYIKSVLSGKNLEVYGLSTANGAKLSLWDNTHANNQQWSLDKSPDGYYFLKNRHSSKVADVSGSSTENAAVIHQWDGWNGNNQKFKIERVR